MHEQSPLPPSPLALAFALALALAAPSAAQDVGLPLGERPDPVILEDLDGQAVDLADFLGQRPVLLEFWATWCPLCDALQPRIDEAHERFGDEVEFLIVAVGVNQTPRAVRRHVARNDMRGRVLWDGRGAATRAFMAPTTSYVVLLDAAGAVAYTGMGSDQDIVAAIERVLGRKD